MDPDGLDRHLRSSRLLRLLLAVAELIARVAILARARLATGRSLTERLTAENDALRSELARMRSERERFRERLEKVPPRNRPHFSPAARLEILWHAARYGLSVEVLARTFLVTPATISRWRQDLRRGVSHLVRFRQPLNRLPDVVADLVHRLKLEQAVWGTRRIAWTLARLGLKLSRTSVQRILRRPRPRRRPRPARATRAYPGLRPKRAGHMWITDLTRVRRLILGDIYIGAVIDLFSRKVLAIRAWAHVPTAADVRALLVAAVLRYGPPAWIVTDHGTQFTARKLRRLLKRFRIRRRFGAVASNQSVAVIERFWESMKREALADFFGFRPLSWVQRRLTVYQCWFNGVRPHGGLRGATPNEIHWGRRPPTLRPRVSVRRARLARLDLGGVAAFPIYRFRAAA